MLWLLSPATKGSSILYRRFVHPALIRREAEIDEALARATEQGYTAVLHLGTKGVNYATTVLMQTAIKVRPCVELKRRGNWQLSKREGLQLGNCEFLYCKVGNGSIPLDRPRAFLARVKYMILMIEIIV